MFNLQNRGSSLIEHIHKLHDWLLVFLISISLLVILSFGRLGTNNFSFRRYVSDHTIELIWTLLPVVTVIILVVPSLRLLYLTDLTVAPELTIKTVGNQWYWQYLYPEGSPINSYLQGSTYRLLDTDNRLILPSGLATNVLVTASDVLHSWTVPTIAVKADAVPGRVNKLMVRSKRIGNFFGQCREICGSNHRFIPIALECYLFSLSTFLKDVRRKAKYVRTADIFTYTNRGYWSCPLHLDRTQSVGLHPITERPE